MTPEELRHVGFAEFGRDVRISRMARIYRPNRISLGDEVRIDDLVVLSPGEGRIQLAGRNHIAVGCLLYGTISMAAWSTLSSRVAVYAVSDDFRFDATTYPHEGANSRRVLSEPVRIGSRVVIGTGSTILPGASVADGISVGAMSLVTNVLRRPGLYYGVPARWIRDRLPLEG
jgi:galactoside O-acetyltransferase